MEKEIKEKIKDSHYYKFQGIAPDGFVLVMEEVLEKLKSFDEWKEFKNDPDWIEKETKKILSQDF